MSVAGGEAGGELRTVNEAGVVSFQDDSALWNETFSSSSSEV